MKNERINLTPGFCMDLKAKDKQYFVLDLNCPGLWLRVYPSGFKTWVYHYRPRGKQTSSIKLNPNPPDPIIKNFIAGTYLGFI